MKRIVIMVLVALLIAAGCATPVGEGSVSPTLQRAGVPAHPSALQFAEEKFDIPEASRYRHELRGGNVAYIVEDASLPLVEISILSPRGQFLVPESQAGLAALTSAMLRQGGTRDLTADEVDERLDFLATDIAFGVGSTSASASLDTLRVNLDESLDLMFDMLTEPRFDEARLAINRNRMIESMRRRNDDTRAIEPRYWSELLYGEEFFVNQRSTERSVNAIDADAMRRFVSDVFASGNLVIAASGAISPEELVKKLEAQLDRLPAAQGELAIPDAVEPAPPGLYGVVKDDVNQTRVSIGHPGVKSGHPDEYALRVMNFILGGGGFTSRITQRVRSDEGLAYSAGSQYSFGVHFPGQFRAFLQSKNASVPKAIGIVLEELKRIRTEPVSESDLELAKQGTVASLADIFDSPMGRAQRFAQDHLIGREPPLLDRV